MTARVIDLRSRRGYVPNLVSLTCSQVRAARQQVGLSIPAFTAALRPLLGWTPKPGMIRAWESDVEPPATVVAACRMLTSQGAPTMAVDVPPGPSYAQPTAAYPDDAAAAMREFRTADLQRGGGHLYPVVLRYLRGNVATRLVTDDDPAVFTSAAALSDMAGWMAHDAGHDDVARHHFVRARDLVACQR